eukprot:ctg_205.g80
MLFGLPRPTDSSSRQRGGSDERSSAPAPVGRSLRGRKRVIEPDALPSSSGASHLHSHVDRRCSPLGHHREHRRRDRPRGRRDDPPRFPQKLALPHTVCRSQHRLGVRRQAAHRSRHRHRPRCRGAHHQAAARNPTALAPYPRRGVVRRTRRVAAPHRRLAAHLVHRPHRRHCQLCASHPALRRLHRAGGGRPTATRCHLQPHPGRDVHRPCRWWRLPERWTHLLQWRATAAGCVCGHRARQRPLAGQSRPHGGDGARHSEERRASGALHRLRGPQSGVRGLRPFRRVRRVGSVPVGHRRRQSDRRRGWRRVPDAARCALRATRPRDFGHQSVSGTAVAISRR